MGENISDLTISISDYAGSPGCVLANSMDEIPAEDGHQVFIVLPDATSGGTQCCTTGTYQIQSSCGPFDWHQLNCAEYRPWQGGEPNASPATSGTISISSNTACTSGFDFNITLDFETTGTFTSSFSADVSGGKPWCQPCE